MNIRVITLKDIEVLKNIHEKYYKYEFEFPDFLNGFLSVFVITDDNDNIITGGGIRLIAESVIITDKDYPIEGRRIALITMLENSAIMTKSKGYNQLHAFVQDHHWMRHLERVGFIETKGNSLVLNL